VLYSIMPPEDVLFDIAPRGAMVEAPLGDGAGTLLLRVGADGRLVVDRLLSTDPRRYLDRRLAPGAPWRP